MTNAAGGYLPAPRFSISPNTSPKVCFTRTAQNARDPYVRGCATSASYRALDRGEV